MTITIHLLSLCVEFSLNVVKDSLRRLKWQKERIAVHVDTTSSTASTQTIQRKMCDAIVQFVQVINVGDKLLVSLLNALQYNKIRAEVCPLQSVICENSPPCLCANLAPFRTSKSLNSLTVPCNVVVH